MQPRYITFSINEYDQDGDCTEKGVFLHFEGTRVKAADTIKDFSDIVRHFESMVSEIEQKYANEA